MSMNLRRNSEIEPIYGCHSCASRADCDGLRGMSLSQPRLDRILAGQRVGVTGKTYIAVGFYCAMWKKADICENPPFQL